MPLPLLSSERALFIFLALPPCSLEASLLINATWEFVVSGWEKCVLHNVVYMASKKAPSIEDSIIDQGFPSLDIIGLTVLIRRMRMFFHAFLKVHQWHGGPPDDRKMRLCHFTEIVKPHLVRCTNLMPLFIHMIEFCNPLVSRMTEYEPWLFFLKVLYRKSIRVWDMCDPNQMYLFILYDVKNLVHMAKFKKYSY